jgi:DNA-binding MarR family transcriptional regulator
VKRATSEEDKRETVITLTQSGIAILDATTVAVNKVMDESLTVSNSDAALLNELLEKIRCSE